VSGLRDGPAARVLALVAFAGGLASAGITGRPAALVAVSLSATIAWLLRFRLQWVTVAALAGVGGLVAGEARVAALAPSPAPPALHDATVTVLESPEAERLGWRALVKAGPARLLVRGGGARPAWETGDLVRLSGSVRRPGAGDGWLEARRISGIVGARAGPVIGRRGGAAGTVDAIRSRALAAFTGSLEPEPAALLAGMVLGDDSAMSPELREQVRRTGLGHIVAASGANVALLVGLVLAGCSLLGLARIPRLMAAGGAVLVYVALCGGGPSILRAAVMGLAVLAAAMASRPASRAYGFALALAVTLAIDPRAWQDVGWQLSFAAVAGIALLAGPLRQRAGRAGVPAVLAEPAALTLAATVATAPVAAGAFGTFSPVSLPANVIVAPLVAPATWLGMVAGLAGQLAPGAARPLVLLAGFPVAGILAVARWLSDYPFAQVRVSFLPVLLLSVAAGCLLGALTRPALRKALLVVAVVVILAVPVAARPGSSSLPGAPQGGQARVSFLDVGQGDATLLQSRGESLLVDTGPEGGPIVERLREAGVERLGALLVTHAQADHLGAAEQVLEEVGAGLLLDGRDGVAGREGSEVAEAAARKGVPRRVPRAGDALRVGELKVSVLWPEGEPVAGVDPNLRSVVLRVDGPGLSVLLGADAESEVLTPLEPGAVQVLKVSHHGSDDPGLAELLADVGPSLAVVSVGAGNPFGHPAPATLGKLAASGAQVLRTDLHGSISVQAAQGGLRVQRWP